jgi:hypothetical protein
VHAEPRAAAALARTIEIELGWTAAVAADGQVIPIAR